MLSFSLRINLSGRTSPPQQDPKDDASRMMSGSNCPTGGVIALHGYDGGIGVGTPGTKTCVAYEVQEYPDVAWSNHCPMDVILSRQHSDLLGDNHFLFGRQSFLNDHHVGLLRY